MKPNKTNLYQYGVYKSSDKIILKKNTICFYVLVLFLKEVSVVIVIVFGYCVFSFEKIIQ